MKYAINPRMSPGRTPYNNWWVIKKSAERFLDMEYGADAVDKTRIPTVRRKNIITSSIIFGRFFISINYFRILYILTDFLLCENTIYVFLSALGKHCLFLGSP